MVSLRLSRIKKTFTASLLAVERSHFLMTFIYLRACQGKEILVALKKNVHEISQKTCNAFAQKSETDQILPSGVCARPAASFLYNVMQIGNLLLK